MSYTITSLEKINQSDILTAYNSCYKSQLDLSAFKILLLDNNIELTLSPAVFNESGELIGFILIGLGRYENEISGYIGGFGIIPSIPEDDLLKQMYDFILPKLHHEGIIQLFCEVKDKDHHKLEQLNQLDFKVVHSFNFYSGNIPEFEYDGSIQVRILVDRDWERFKSFWDVIPSWQNSSDAVEKLIDDVFVYGAFNDGDHLIGYIAYNSINHQVLQIAVDKSYRSKGIAKALIHHILINHDRQLLFNNIDTKSKDIIQLIKSLGLHKDYTSKELLIRI